MARIKEINVLVTGMGPYPDGRGGHIDVNTSYLITTLLPVSLQPNTGQNPSTTYINIKTLPHPIKAEYEYARDFLKELHSKHSEDVDLFIHLGEARGWDFLTVERVAYKQGMSSVWWSSDEEKGYYGLEDDVGQVVDDIGTCPWDNVPMGLRTALNVDAVIEGAMAIQKLSSVFGKTVSQPATTDCGGGDNSSVTQHRANVSKASSPITVKPHDEGGPFLCGFVNYESLANRYVRKLKPNVLFCHMPGEADPENLTRTRQGILAIVVAAANEVVKQKAA